MFNLGTSSLLAGQHDCKKEREPPKRPTPVTFPSLTPPEPSLEHLPPEWSEGSSSGIPACFRALKKPSDVNRDVLALLNVSFRPQCDFETLFSSVSKDMESYLPPKSWLEITEMPANETGPSTASSSKLLSNGRKPPDERDFYMRARELFFKNEDAFGVLSRKIDAPSKTPIRLAHFRKFWECLDNMAYYWDASLDEYLPPKREGDSVCDESNLASAPNTNPDEPENIEADRQNLHTDEPRKKAKTGDEGSSKALPVHIREDNGATSSAPTTPVTSSKSLPARTAPPNVPSSMQAELPSDKELDLSNGSYRGYRIGNGAEMPEQYRLECVRAFLEPIAWAFGVTFAPHRRPPVVCLQDVRFPVRMSAAGWRGPTDRMKARQGWLEGPIIGVQCRSETNFNARKGSQEAQGILDVARELGGLLLLAQERAREGKTEKRAGEGKWWTTKPRWGGGPGGEVGEAAGPSDDPKAKTDDKPMRDQRGGLRRRPNPVETWKTLRPSNPLWDPRVTYEAIGKDLNQEWDEVFMISSLNHHISILKLRVHPLYMQYLAEGVLPHAQPDNSWSSPTFHRTRWYDLFNVDDRTEAMRGIWGIMAYLMRPREKGDVVMKEG
ncbi:hypothetical protein GQ43DRAFT_441440 [Delitschia confertaspora ATCC 74209]|uniref:Uncharacterized protein n=1 Tax=Delitschia confertaspora ATCC 74209 TaxID=1513339 RepID=A0A9P4JLT8_9PLEO|nr:hypothetical protein GQ43DRAFT_441440 [Delitschia confertaspora ATCC 74209]